MDSPSSAPPVQDSAVAVESHPSRTPSLALTPMNQVQPCLPRYSAFREPDKLPRWLSPGRDTEELEVESGDQYWVRSVSPAMKDCRSFQPRLELSDHDVVR